ncbi:nitrate/nitrite transporter [Salinisphaera sp. LB1]|uniref:MFS transporter n=1 Tax=Salinisphaera sp. LB1 TaxID=2183911 RepID=UPI000D7082C8|nr:MFS transporter [Salinisphaera sp. LB1]AWN15755.1 Nitrate/nitrite transporter [Salinisphaera sp. LB1]
MAIGDQLSTRAQSIAGSPSKALFGATLGFFIGFGAVSLFGPTAQNFIEVMKLSPGQVGFLVAIPMLTGSLLRIPFGAWVDNNGGKLPFLILLVMSVLGIAGLWWMLISLYPAHLTQSYYPLLLFFGALGGCGIATFSVGIGQVSYWFPKQRQGWALGTYAGLGNTSPGLVALILPLIIAFWGLWAAYMLSIAIVVIGVALYFGLSHNAGYFQLRKQGLSREDARQAATEAGQELFPQDNAFRTLVEAARQWRTWPLVLLYFTTFGGFLALTAWLATYWQTYFHTTHWTAVELTAGFSLLSSLIRVPGGSWADRLGGEKVAVASLTLLLFGALLMTFSGTFVLSIAGEICIAIGMGVNNAAVFCMLPRYVPDAVGGASGWVGGLGALGGFAVPPLLGQFVEWFGPSGYAWGFSVYIGLALASIALTGVLMAAMKRQQRRQPAATPSKASA